VDNVRLAGKSSIEASNQAKSKKMSWANVASQPAKLQIAAVKTKRPGTVDSFCLFLILITKFNTCLKLSYGLWSFRKPVFQCSNLDI
jgi:hypothetical protein